MGRTWKQTAPKGLWWPFLALAAACAGGTWICVAARPDLPCEEPTELELTYDGHETAYVSRRPGWCMYRGKLAERVGVQVSLLHERRPGGGHAVYVKGSLQNRSKTPVLDVEALVNHPRCGFKKVSLGAIDPGESQVVKRLVCDVADVSGGSPTAGATARVGMVQLHHQE